jgi:hypothetical protein
MRLFFRKNFEVKKFCEFKKTPIWDYRMPQDLSNIPHVAVINPNRCHPTAHDVMQIIV